MTTIDVLARRIGELRAAELTLFATLGAWALDPTAPPAERTAFAAGAHRAAWRAEQLAVRAPVLAAVPPDDAITPGDDELGRAATALAAAAPEARSDAVLALGALLADVYAAELTAAAPTDGPSRRLFHRLAHDVSLPT